MADVEERAQVLLMAALGMAIMFVALALILNTAIYTENLATRGSEIAGGGDAIRYVDTTRAGIGGTIAYVNRHNHTSHESLQRNFSAAVPEWANASQRQFAHRGRSVDSTLTETKNGTRIEQDDSGRNFTDNGWNESWILAEGVNGTRNFRIEVSDDSSLVELNDPDPFNVTAENGSDRWRMNITHETLGTDVVVGIQSTSGVDATCDSGSDTIWINVTAGTVNGTDCGDLTFAEGVEPPYNITFNNGSAIEGTYTLLVDNNTLATDPSPHLNADGNSPFAEPAIYSANLSVTYQSPRLVYDSTVRVAPGETDD